MRRLVLLPLLFSWACGGSGPEVAADESEATAELRAREGQTTVWAQPRIERRVEADGATRFAIRGRASRNLEGGLGFVQDDPYGELRLVSARRYELVFGTSELTNLIVGVSEFLRLNFAPSAGRPGELTARLVTGPALEAAPGVGLYFDGAPVPRRVDGRVVVQIVGHADRNLTQVSATAGSTPVNARLVDARHFRVDLTVDEFVAIAGSSSRLSVKGTAARSTVQRSASLGLVVQSLELTTLDPYEVWPRPGCDEAVRSCLGALPAGTTDLSRCGTFLEVQACPQGVVVDQAAVDAALVRIEPAVVTLQGDAAALVGARAEALVAAARGALVTQLQLEWRRGFPTAAERDLYLDAQLATVLDRIYARPLDSVPAFAPVANDPLAARQVAADALLLHLASVDLTQTEWGRPLEALTRQFRDRHLAALRELREVGPVVAESSTEWTLGTNWLGALVEVTIDRASGTSSRILFEID